MLNSKSPASSKLALAAVAGAVSGWSASAANAAVVDVTPAPGATSLTLPTGSVAFANDISFAGNNSWGQGFYNRSLAAYGYSGVLVGPGTVAAGSLIDASSMEGATNGVSLDGSSSSFYSVILGYNVYQCGPKSYDTCGYPVYGSQGTTSVADNALGTNLLLPFEFSAGSQTDFGWARFDVSDPGTSNAYVFSLDEYAYTTDGSGIVAGQSASPVPEPTSLMLLASGVLGLAAYRRRQHRND